MPRRFWIDAEDRALALLYPHIRVDDIVRILGRTKPAIYRRVVLLGLEKSPEFNASPLSGRNVKGYAPHGMRTRFQKGAVPANKGLRRPGYHRGRMRETQFKKGHRPSNYLELGTLRLNADGFVDMKVREAKGANAWEAFHRILWRDRHGAIPPGHLVHFKDGDRFNFDDDNLELVSFADNARRNVMWHRYPRPIALAIQLRGQLMRRINRKARHETQHRRPA